MRRAFYFLFAFCAFSAVNARAELLVNSNAVFIWFNSSYWNLNSVGCYVDAGRYLYWPTNNIHCNDDSTGGSLQTANETRLPRYALAQWATGDQWFGEIWGDNNGGYTSNNVISHITDTLSAPGRMFNGSTYVASTGWAGTHAGEVVWILGGAIPYAGHYTGGGEFEEQINNAMTNAAAQILSGATQIGIDVYHPLNFTYGWSNDIQSSAALRQASQQTPPGQDGEHPGPPGALSMAVLDLTAQINTNVNTCILDYGRASVSATNHVDVTNISLAGNVLTLNWKGWRHSPAWDKPNTATGITNDASLFFTLGGAASSNAMHEDIDVTNIPNGSFQVAMDGTNIGTFTASGGRLTINLFSITTGPLWDQRVEVLGLVRDRRYVNRITLAFRSAGDGQGEVSYRSNADAFWGDGDRFDTLISDLSSKITNLNAKDALIWAAAAPVNHTITLTQIITRYMPWHS